MRLWGIAGGTDGRPFGPDVAEHSFEVAPDGSAVVMPRVKPAAPFDGADTNSAEHDSLEGAC